MELIKEVQKELDEQKLQEEKTNIKMMLKLIEEKKVELEDKKKEIEKLEKMLSKKDYSLVIPRSSLSTITINRGSFPIPL